MKLVDDQLQFNLFIYLYSIHYRQDCRLQMFEFTKRKSNQLKSTIAKPNGTRQFMFRCSHSSKKW
jgi:hypothetical protein